LQIPLSLRKKLFDWLIPVLGNKLKITLRFLCQKARELSKINFSPKEQKIQRRKNKP
jgi:hypothetical protein